MKLRDMLNIISIGTKIQISANCQVIFTGKVSDIKVTDWNETVGPHLDKEVYSIDTVMGYITIAV